MSNPQTLERLGHTIDMPRDDSSLPAEIEREISELVPSTISVLAARDVKQASAAAAELQSASIRLTYPTDWVVFQAKDGARLGYLQDAGCQRVRLLWGISFAKFNPKTDLVEEVLDDGHISVEAYVEGRCSITGETLQEVGQRSSAGLFEKAWLDAKEHDQHVALAKLRSDVRKSALANAMGRIVRRISGLSQVPEYRILALLDQRPGSLRGFKFAEGGKGGGGGGALTHEDASDAQLNLIINEAVRGKKLTGGANLEEVREIVAAAKLTKRQASDVITKLKAAGEGSLGRSSFAQLLGIPADPEPGAPR